MWVIDDWLRKKGTVVYTHRYLGSNFASRYFFPRNIHKISLGIYYFFGEGGERIIILQY